MESLKDHSLDSIMLHPDVGERWMKYVGPALLEVKKKGGSLPGNDDTRFKVSDSGYGQLSLIIEEIEMTMKVHPSHWDWAEKE